MALLTTRERTLAIVVLSTILAFQVYAVILAFWQAPTFTKLFAGLGGPLPLVTRSFLASYPYWWIVPLVFALMSFDLLRRSDPPRWYFAATVSAAAAIAFGMYAWMREAIYAPLFEILDKIG